MEPKLSGELSDALRRQAGPLEVQDDDGKLRYVIVPKEEYRQLLDHEFHQWLQQGLDEEARGQASPWNLDDVLAEAHRRFNERQAG